MADLTLDNWILRDVNQKSDEAVGAPSNGGLSHYLHFLTIYSKLTQGAYLTEIADHLWRPDSMTRHSFLRFTDC